MGISKIRLCHDLTAVARLVGRQQRHAMAMRRLRRTRTKEHNLVLAAPATAALAIDESGIAWPTDRPLRVAILSTNTYEFLDDGQWYRFTPAMLGKHGDIEVHAFSRTPDSARISTVKDVLNRRYHINARWSEESFASASSEDSFDIALSFSGLTGGPVLMDELVTLSEMGTPLYLTSFSSTHALLTHAVLRAHGADAQSVVARNPFGLVSKRIGENWNRVISKVTVDSLPQRGTSIDGEYLESLGIVAAMVLQSHRLGDASQTWPVGGIVNSDVVHTLDGIAIDVRTRQIIDLSTDLGLGHLSPDLDDVVREFSDEWDETDKLIWAAHIRYFAMAQGISIADAIDGAAI